MNQNEMGTDNPTDHSRLLSELDIESVLQQFRFWLQGLNELPEPQAHSRSPIDLATLVSQFTALRQEVNLQTKAFRNTIAQLEPLQNLPEQVGEIKKRLAQSESPPKPETEFKSLVKSLLDIHDALVMAYRQVSKQSEEISQFLNIEVQEPLDFPEQLVELASSIAHSTSAETPKPRGFFAKLFRGKPQIPVDSRPNPNSDSLQFQAKLRQWHQSINERLSQQADHLSSAQARLATSLSSLLVGYELSISRVEKAILKTGLTPIPTEGQRFDPEKMEVVEVIPAEGGNSGYVAQEVRRGYLQGEIIFRYAQVKVYQ